MQRLHFGLKRNDRKLNSAGVTLIADVLRDLFLQESLQKVVPTSYKIIICFPRCKPAHIEGLPQRALSLIALLSRVELTRK